MAAAMPAQQLSDAPTELKVVHVEEDYDMRSGWHHLRESRKVGNLCPGECALWMNVKCTIALVIDSEGNPHILYADEGEKFSPEMLREKVAYGMATVLVVLPEAKKKKRSRLHAVA